jgi:hypothetical protein
MLYWTAACLLMIAIGAAIVGFDAPAGPTAPIALGSLVSFALAGIAMIADRRRAGRRAPGATPARAVTR